MESSQWLDRASLKRGSLSGRTVVITGGSEGIGKAMVEAFIQYGSGIQKAAGFCKAHGEKPV